MATEMNYLNPSIPESFGGKSKFLKKFKKVDPKWFNSLDVYTLHKPKRKKFPTRSYRAKYPNQFWQADLNDMISISKENNGFKYILTAVDVFSRFGMAIPLKTKTGLEVTEGFKKLFKEHGTPKYIHTDEGKEFENAIFRNFLLQQESKQFSVKSEYKAGIVERFNRTLKERMFRYFTHVKNKNWVDILPNLLSAYNNSIHRTIKMTPIQAMKKQDIVFTTQEQRILRKPKKSPKFKVGDIVRLSKVKNIFEKGYTRNWTTELFQIVEIDLKYMPIMYKVMDMDGEVIQGKFYKEELQFINNSTLLIY